MKTSSLIFVLFLFANKLYAQQINLTNYHFLIKSTGITRLEKLFTNDENITNKPDEQLIQNFEGVIAFTAIKKIKDIVLYEVKITTSKYELLNGKYQALEQGFLVDDLQLPFYITTNKKGAIILFQFLQNVNKNAQKVLKEVFSYFQISNIKNTDYEVTEMCPTGNALVQYKVAKNNAVVKAKIKFINKENTENELKTTYEPTGKLIIKRNKQNNVLLSINGTETTNVLLNNKVAGIATNTIAIHYIMPKVPAAKALLQKLQNYTIVKSQCQQVKMYEPITSNQLLVEARKQTLATDNFESIIKKLANSNNEEKDSLYLKVRALVTVYPTLAYSFLPMLDTSKAETFQYSIIWMSLLHSQSAEATNAICSILLQHKDDWDWIKNIVSNLGVAKIITDTMVNTLKALHSKSNNAKIVRTTELALGSIVDNLNKLSPIKSTNLYNWLIANINMQSTDDKTIMQNILVLGNTNTHKAKNEIKKYLFNTSIEVKELAVQTLQKLN